MGAEGDEPLVLLASVAPQDPTNCLGEVVQPQDPEGAPQVVKAPLEPVEERGLALGRVGDVEAGGGELRADNDDLRGLPSPREVEVGLVEVGLGLLAHGMVLGNERLDADAELPSAPAHVLPHGRLPGCRAELLDHPLPDPPGRVPLLAGSGANPQRGSRR